MTGDSANPLALLERSVKLKLYVMLRRTVDRAQQTAKLGAHLTWMIGAEKAGKIFLSGPVMPHDGPTALHGLTIIRADSLVEAEAIAAEDPYVAGGVVTFEMREWLVNEGAIPVTITLSDSTASFR